MLSGAAATALPSGRLAVAPGTAQGRVIRRRAKPPPSRRRFRPRMLAVHRCKRAVMHEVNLVSATLKHADLRGVEFKQAFMQEAHLDGANLVGADFTEADLANTYFRGAVFDEVALRSVARRARRWRDNTIRIRTSTTKSGRPCWSSATARHDNFPFYGARLISLAFHRLGEDSMRERQIYPRLIDACTCRQSENGSEGHPWISHVSTSGLSRLVSIRSLVWWRSAAKRRSRIQAAAPGLHLQAGG